MQLPVLPSPPAPLTLDGFKRRVSYLRVSLTDRCNLGCRYCMPNRGIKYFSKESLLSLGELKRLLKILKDLGVAKIKLTGGEPLLRLELEEIISEVIRLGITDVSLTTNGVLLDHRSRSLVSAGLKRINISLDTLQRERFYKITGSDALDQVLKGIESAAKAGLAPVKINMVVMREWNINEIEEFALLTKRFPLEVRFLELMPTANNFEGTAGVNAESFVSIDEIKKRIEKIVNLGAEEFYHGVARVYPVVGGLGKIGLISPVSNHFCESCNRIRLTARGTLKTCLHGPDSADLKVAMRAGSTDEDLKQLVRNALSFKPEEHFIRPEHYISSHLQMSQIGG